VDKTIAYELMTGELLVIETIAYELMTGEQLVGEPMVDALMTVEMTASEPKVGEMMVDEPFVDALIADGVDDPAELTEDAPMVDATMTGDSLVGEPIVKAVNDPAELTAYEPLVNEMQMTVVHHEQQFVPWYCKDSKWAMVMVVELPIDAMELYMTRRLGISIPRCSLISLICNALTILTLGQLYQWLWNDRMVALVSPNVQPNEIVG
jgi:hypothetical protein